MTKQEVLQRCTVEDNVVKLPDIQLERKLYLEVKTALELIGGKWKGRKVSGFVFHDDPTELLSEIALGGNRNLKKEYQYFATPPELASRLVELADLQPNDSVLEPSAGQGAIVEEINQLYGLIPDCYEIMKTNRTIMSKRSDIWFNPIGEDFLEANTEKKYSKIIANPPFAKNQDIKHVYKMWDVLKEEGKIVTIMSKHWQNVNNKKEVEFQEWLNYKNHRIFEIEAGAFKESGTMISAIIVVINK